MPVAHEVSISREVFHWIAFPHRVIAFDIIQGLVFEHKVTTIDPTFAILAFFVKVGDLIPGEADTAETSRRADSRDRSQPAVTIVEFYQSRDIEIRDSVAVSQHERLVFVQPLLQALDATPGLSVKAGVDEMDFPVGVFAVMKDGFTGGQIDRNIVVERKEVEKVVFDNFLLVSKRDNEFIETMSAVGVHDVP